MRLTHSAPQKYVAAYIGNSLRRLFRWAFAMPDLALSTTRLRQRVCFKEPHDPDTKGTEISEAYARKNRGLFRGRGSLAAPLAEPAYWWNLPASTPTPRMCPSIALTTSARVAVSVRSRLVSSANN